MSKLKKYVVTYSLTFYNTEEIEAESAPDAEKKLWLLEEEQGELSALDGWEKGYKIECVKEVKEASSPRRKSSTVGAAQ